MNRQAGAGRSGRAAAWVNLLLPGGGLILVGRIGSGLLLGLLFAACMNFAIVAILLFPDDFSRPTQIAGILLTAGSYLVAQVRLAYGLRGVQMDGAAVRRAQVLREVQERLAHGEITPARAAIERLAEELPQDLAVAYKLAEILTAAGDIVCARAAWRRLRELDRHGIYRAQVRASEQQLKQAGAR